MTPHPPRSTLFPYTTLFRSRRPRGRAAARRRRPRSARRGRAPADRAPRSEEHTSELQSLTNLVCRLLLEKKKRPDTGAAFRDGGNGDTGCVSGSSSHSYTG